MSPHLKALHRLPIKQRFAFKWFVLIFKIFHLGVPSYFSDYFVRHTSAANTRRSSADNMFLSREVIPFVRRTHKSKTHFDHCFYTNGPVRWNSLPSEIRCAPTISLFRSRLKTYLFNQAYPP